MSTTAGRILTASSERGTNPGESAPFRRRFTDRSGVEWTVSECPAQVAETVVRERRSVQRSRRGNSRQASRGADAAARFATRPLCLPALQFDSARERRRLSPTPAGWRQMPDDELEDLLGESRP